jgi:predicted small metal-binding protein
MFELRGKEEGEASTATTTYARTEHDDDETKEDIEMGMK